MPAPTLDGTATGIAGGGNPISAILTTTGTNRIICALIYTERGTCPYVTGVSGGGLTWQKRTSATISNYTGNDAETLELWWALAPAALTAATITATISAVYDDGAMLVFGVAGCNITNPWDANPSLAARTYYFGAAAPSFSGISTTQANDFLIFGWGSNANVGIGTVPTGFTAIGSTVNGGGSLFASIAAAYRGVTAAQSNQTYTWGSGNGGTNAAIFDVLTADTGGVTALSPNWEVISGATPSSTNVVGVGIAAPSPNDTISILSYCQNSGGGPAISSISGGGLTWTQRSRSHSSARGSLEVWSAQVTGTLVLSTITVNYAATFDSAALLALSIVGCDSSVWDANASLPKALSNTAGGGWTPSVSAVSTTQAHDMILAAVGATGGATAGSVSTVPAGFVLVGTATNSGGGQVALIGVGRQQRNTTQSSATIAWGAGINDFTNPNAGGEYVVDALTADGAVVVGTAQARAMVLA